MDDKSVIFTSMADFLTQCQRAMRYRRLSYLTELSYLGWIKKFVRHFKRIKPRIASAQAREYLTNLATECAVSAATQNVALSRKPGI